MNRPPAHEGGPIGLDPVTPGMRYGASPRSILAAVTVSLLLILTYYIAQAFAQFIYILLLLAAGWIRAARHGLPIADLQTDIWHALERVQSQYTVVAVIYGLILAVSYAAFIRARGRGRSAYVWLGRPKRSHTLASIAVALGMLGSANLVFAALSGLTESIPVIGDWMTQYQAVVDSAFPAGAGVIGLLLGVCVLVPIAEELLFRGIVLGELSAVMPPWLAVLVQALLFSLFHMQGIQSLYVFIPGLAMGIAYLATRSIWVPIWMHMVFNLIGSGALNTIMGGESVVTPVLGVTLLGFIPIGLMCLVWLGKNRVTGGVSQTTQDRSQINGSTQEVRE